MLDWSICILGERDARASYGRTIIGSNRSSIWEAVAYLQRQPAYAKGVILVKHWHGQTDRRVSGIGSVSRIVHLRDLVHKARLSPYDGTDLSNFVFVPFTGRCFPKTRSHTILMDWAISGKLPYVFLHDNDHVWFTGFPRRMERSIFWHFLRGSVVRMPEAIPKIAPGDWSVIRTGLYEHGWTLNHLQVAYENGIATYVLWGGISGGGLLEGIPASRFSKRLTIFVGRDRVAKVSLRRTSCVLDSMGGLART